MSGDGTICAEEVWIDRYQLVAPLGTGASGTVYEALQYEPHRRVALEVARDASSPTDWERLRYEADVLARLNHPSIAQVHDTGRTSVTGANIAMEFVEGARHITCDSIQESNCAAIASSLPRDWKPSAKREWQHSWRLRRTERLSR